MVTERMSRNTEAASSKVTPCFRRFERAFSGSQRKTGPIPLDCSSPSGANSSSTGPGQPKRKPLVASPGGNDFLGLPFGCGPLDLDRLPAPASLTQRLLVYRLIIPVEQLQVTERRVQFTGLNRLEVDGLDCSVVEANPQSIRRHDLETNNAIDGMAHRFILAAQSAAGFFLAVEFPNLPSIHSDVIQPKPFS